MKYYPVFLNLKDKLAVVVGGGRVAELTTSALLKARASVRVISPAITKTLEKYKLKGLVTHISREYRSGDLKGAFIIIAATSSEEINCMVDADSGKSSLLVNIVDKPSKGNFIAPSIVRRGQRTLAISTEGASPALSKAIRRELEESFGPEFSDYLKFVNCLRKEVLNKIPDSRKREDFLKYVASDETIKILRRDGAKKAIEKIRHKLRRISTD